MVFQVYQKFKVNFIKKNKPTIAQYSVIIKNLPKDIQVIEIFDHLNKFIVGCSEEIEGVFYFYQKVILINDLT